MSTSLTFSCSINKIKSFISYFIKSPLKQLLRTSCVVWAVMGFSYSSLSIFYLSSVLSLCSLDQNSSLTNCRYPWVSAECGKSSASTIHHRTFVKKMAYKTFAVAVYIPVTELCCYCLLLSLLMFALTSGEKKENLNFLKLRNVDCKQSPQTICEIFCATLPPSSPPGCCTVCTEGPTCAVYQ